MKKLFFIAAMASVALVGCTKNEPAPSVTEQHAITFAAPVVGTTTKVNGAIGTTYDTGEKFDVWCVYNTADITEWGGTTYFTDVATTYNATQKAWELDKKYYWPATGLLSFVALSPSIVNATTYDQTKGFEVTAWSQGATQDAIVDLMYSDPSFNNAKSTFANGADNTGTDDNNVYKYNGVDIMFHHALSYITFNVRTFADYSSTTEFKLNKITLSGVYTTGNFTQKATDPWVEDTDVAKTGTYVAYTGNLEFGNSVEPAPSASGKEVILVPQALVDSQQKLTVNYQISTDGGTTWLDQVQEIDLNDAGVAAWEMGKKYTYTVIVKLHEIYLDPAVTDWTPESGGDLTI